MCNGTLVFPNHGVLSVLKSEVPLNNFPCLKWYIMA